jgi:hypothetical protein
MPTRNSPTRRPAAIAVRRPIDKPVPMMARTLARNHHEDGSPLCAQSHADSNFLRSVSYGVGHHHSVNADHRQRESQKSESCRKLRA